MSVLVKGMEMPTCCFSCPMCDVENAEVNCAISHGSYIEYREVDPQVAIQERPPWCPLVRVPPHSDLIDRDKLREKEFIHDGDAYAVVMSRDIRNAATIIPADKDGEI